MTTVAAPNRLEELEERLDSGHYELVEISGMLGIEFTETTPQGERLLKAKFSSELRNEEPIIKSISVRYESSYVPRWDLSQAEQMCLMQMARKQMLKFCVSNAKSVYAYRMPREGQYFSIEGHRNFLKTSYTESDEHLFLICGTGNSSYERTYIGQFLVAGNTVYCLGHKFNSNAPYKSPTTAQRIAEEPKKLFKCFTYNPIGRMYHQYR